MSQVINGPRLHLAGVAVVDCEKIHTEVGMSFQVLQYRKDRTGLKQLIEQGARYQRIDADTLETISVMKTGRVIGLWLGISPVEL